MDYKALIDFNKFTLALSAAGLVYVLERFTPANSTLLFISVLTILCLFLVSVLAGIFLFAAATSNLHSEKKATDEGKANRIEEFIKRLGIIHIAGLGLGMAILGVVILTHVVFAKNDIHSESDCCCVTLKSEDPSSGQKISDRLH